MAEYSPAMPDVEETADPERRSRRTPNRSTALDDVANDLAYWIDDTANKIALAFAPGRAPFAAQVTEQDKLEFYKRQLFNPDGSPNVSGRSREIARLGAEGFGQVYKAVVQAYPELKPPAEPELAPFAEPPPAPPMMMPGPAGPPPLPMGGQV